MPLIILTADRPWELHGFGAPQTLDQTELFGAHVRAFENFGLPEATDAAFRHLRALVSVAADKATRGPRGPVHLNVPFREPLAPLPDAVMPSSLSAGAVAAHAFERTAAGVVISIPPSVAAVLQQEPRGVIVVGPRAQADGLAGAVAALSNATGYPVLAEAASNVRYGASSFALYDLFLRSEGFAAAHTPRVVIKIGGGLTSKRLSGWLDGSGAFTVLVSEEGALVDPEHRANAVLEGPAPRVLGALAEQTRRGTTDWTRAFASVNERASAALEDVFLRDPRLTEPRIAHEVVRALPDQAQLMLASSMPVRDVDAFAPRAPGRVRVFSNRGANGIDGTLSSALGIAASSGKPTVVLTGDLAFLHDLGGLLVARRSGIPLTVVVVNNDGGGIFSFLPVASVPEHFETLFGTPHGLSFEHAAALYGAHYHAPRTVAGLREALKASVGAGLAVVELQVPRASNVAEHQALYQAVTRALEARA